MGKSKFTTFYSWQSYIGGYANRSYIRDKIVKVFKEKDIELSFLEDARGESGATDIADAILTKISQSDIFICDVTPVTILDLGHDKQRAIPNPNVMFELGFAVRCLGWERIICICNEEYGSVENLPFDIASHRIVTYKRKADSKKSEVPLSLVFDLGQIIENYDQIISKTNEFNYKEHDIGIYEKLMSFTTEQDFINGLEDFKSVGRYFRWYVKCWEHFQYFQYYPENRFISPVLNGAFSKLVDSLDALRSLTIKVCREYNTLHWEYMEIEYTTEQIKDILMTQEYRKRDIPYPENEHDENAIRKYYNIIENDEKEIFQTADAVIKSYSEFRSIVKRELLV